MIWKSETNSQVNPDGTHLQILAPREEEFKPKGMWTEQVSYAQDKDNESSQGLC